MPAPVLIHVAVAQLIDHRQDGDLLSDAPAHDGSIEKLIELAEDRDEWRKRVHKLAPKKKVNKKVASTLPQLSPCFDGHVNVPLLWTEHHTTFRPQVRRVKLRFLLLSVLPCFFMIVLRKKFRLRNN